MSRLIHSDNGLDNTVYGENLASNAGTGTWGDLRHPEKIMIRWVEKDADDGWPANSHLTQVLWRATKYVGCYEHALDWRGGMCHIQVCRYARPGMSHLHSKLQPSVSFVHTSDHAISAFLFYKVIATWALTRQTREIRGG